jgi:stage II sporulation protein GA (sporulation sigma-E factor processing peptidase)
MVKYVYIDVLFATNLVVNYLILLATGKLAGRAVKTGRLLLASGVGALYAASALVFPLTAAYSLAARLAFGLFMVALSFPGQTVQSFVTVAVSFYLCSAMAAGTAMALQSYRVSALLQNAVVPSGDAAVHWWIVAASLTVLSIFPIVARAGGFQPGKPLPLIGLELEVGGRTLGLTGLVDTGNNLRDPVSNLPVVVVDWEPLRAIMPGEVFAFFLSTWDSMPEDLSRTPMGKRLRLIPYESLSGRKGVLPGFRPDHVVILEKDGHRVRKDAIVGVSGERLSPSGLYQALLHPDLVSLS